MNYEVNNQSAKVTTKDDQLRFENVTLTKGPI